MIEVPVGGVISGLLGALRATWSWFATPVERLLFRRAYEVSTLYELHRHGLGKRPRQLHDNLEYDLTWSRYYMRQRLSSPQFWLRTTAKGAKYSRAVLTVTASSSLLSYQTVLTIYDITEQPIQTAIQGLPFRHLTFNGNLGYQNYDSVTTELRELFDNDGNPVHIYGRCRETLHPFDDLEVALGHQVGDLEKWGAVFNLKFLELEIREERIRMIGRRFGKRGMLIGLRNSVVGSSWLVRLNFWRKMNRPPFNGRHEAR